MGVTMMFALVYILCRSTLQSVVSARRLGSMWSVRGAALSAYPRSALCVSLVLL